MCECVCVCVLYVCVYLLVYLRVCVCSYVLLLTDAPCVRCRLRDLQACGQASAVLNTFLNVNKVYIYTDATYPH